MVMLLIVLIALVAVLGGLTCFVVAIVMMVTGSFRPAFRAPAPGGSVFLEIVAVFTGAFLLIKVLLPMLVVGQDGHVADWGMKFHLIVQWAVVPVIFWPVVRGMRFADFRRRLGWHSGRGVIREAATGLFAYLASLPLLVVAAVVSLVLLKLFKGTPDGGVPQVKNPVVDVISHAGSVELLMFFVLATCWAPLVEEAVFRGAFFGHLRSRVSLLLAAAVSAFVFGVMHGYEFLMLAPVMALGFTFALMREWRGSLVAPMTAHFVHNGTLMTVLILLLPVLRD
jgi:membrane protease YdiL (CAAX protease family)